jgi:hypothetical protein
MCITYNKQVIPNGKLYDCEIGLLITAEDMSRCVLKHKSLI